MADALPSQARDLERDAWCQLLKDETLAEAFRALPPEAQDTTLAQVLPFGTAGIRAMRGLTPRHFNKATLLRCVHALRQQFCTESGCSVVLGRDGRAGGEAALEAISDYLRASGVDVRRFPEPVPTPVLAFATRHYQATLGLCITASHNPPSYNGMKVFGPGAAQLEPSTTRAIDASVRQTPLTTVAATLGAQMTGKHTFIERTLTTHYVDALKASLPPKMPDRGLSALAATALGGVGANWLDAVLADEGVDVRWVAEEREVAPGFEGIASPNPEHSRALARLRAQLDTAHCSLGMALDPDADRIALTEMQADGSCRDFAGNEIGTLLARWAAGTRSAERPSALVVASYASAAGLEDMGARLGFEVARSGTGFAKMAARLREIPDAAQRRVLCFEEALGYCLFDWAHDKDALQASLALLRCLAERPRGLHEAKPLLSALFELDASAGAWRYAQARLQRGTSSSESLPWYEALTERALPLTGFSALAPLDPARPAEAWLARSPEGSRVLVRASGTEPLIKVYVDWRCDRPPSSLQTDREACAVAEDAATRVGDWLGSQLGGELTLPGHRWHGVA